ncbi:MAG TPA: lipocalin family protein [Chitinophagaceae bacterium]
MKVRKMLKGNNVPLCLIILFLLSCAEDKAASDKKQLAANSSVTSNRQQTAPDAGQENGIQGTWKLNLEAYDDNGNKVLDDEERKKAIRNNYLLQFKANGTCRIQDFYNGTYRITDESGQKLLSVQRERIKGEETEDPPPDLYYIKSLTKDELILLASVAGFTHTFWIFKKVK